MGWLPFPVLFFLRHIPFRSRFRLWFTPFTLEPPPGWTSDLLHVLFLATTPGPGQVIGPSASRAGQPGSSFSITTNPVNSSLVGSLRGVVLILESRLSSSALLLQVLPLPFYIAQEFDPLSHWYRGGEGRLTVLHRITLNPVCRFGDWCLRIGGLFRILSLTC